jgi:hypothetical protein
MNDARPHHVAKTSWRVANLPAFPRTIRNRLQFNLRTFIVAISLFSVCLGLLTIWIRSSLSQRSLVNDVRLLGGTVIYQCDFEYREWRRKNPETMPAIPLKWRWPPEVLQRSLGIDFFNSVHTIDLTGSAAKPADCQRIRQRLPHEAFLN